MIASLLANRTNPREKKVSAISAFVGSSHADYGLAATSAARLSF